MTLLPWPAGRVRHRSAKPRELIVDPLPKTVLHTLVSDIPGPPGETGAARATRFEAQLAEVLAFNPRDSVEAMLAVQCVVLRLVAEDAHRDAARPNLTPALARKIPRGARELTKLAAEMQAMLRERQTHPAAKMDPALFRSLGLEAFLVPGPDAFDDTAEAVSAIIVPLHPAPKMLQ